MMCPRENMNIYYKREILLLREKRVAGMKRIDKEKQLISEIDTKIENLEIEWEEYAKNN